MCDTFGLIFCGSGAVATCVMQLMYVREPWFLDLPIVIIDCQKNILKNPIIVNIFGELRAEGDNNVFSKRNACFINAEIKQHNYKEVLNNAYASLNARSACIKKGIMIELAYRLDTSSLIDWCESKNFMYINTAIDKWTLEHETGLLELKNKIAKKTYKNTMLFNHGMNPGLVSHFAKNAIDVLYSKYSKYSKCSKNSKNTKESRNITYADKASAIGLTKIIISERDTQYSTKYAPSKILGAQKIVNTWSVIGFLDEAYDHVQVTSHDNIKDTIKTVQCQKILKQRAKDYKVKSYEPMEGMITGYCIPHAETYSLGLLLDSVKNLNIYYCYFICKHGEDALKHEDQIKLNYSNYYVLRAKDIDNDSMYDSVGCLLNTKYGKFWAGTILTNGEAKRLSPDVNATTIQVASSIVGAVIWMINHPNEGIIEPETVDSRFILMYAKPYLGKFIECQEI